MSFARITPTPTLSGARLTLRRLTQGIGASGITDEVRASLQKAITDYRLAFGSSGISCCDRAGRKHSPGSSDNAEAQKIDRARDLLNSDQHDEFLTEIRGIFAED